MGTRLNATEVDCFATLLRTFRRARRERKEATRGSRTARRALSAKQREHVLRATDGRCHICGGEIGDAAWHADHVLAHSSGGPHALDNYLPAHVLCNNYRWDYSPKEFQQILKIGVWTRTQIERKTPVGKLIARQYLVHEATRQNRRKGRVSNLRAPRVDDRVQS